MSALLPADGEVDGVPFFPDLFEGQEFDGFLMVHGTVHILPVFPFPLVLKAEHGFRAPRVSGEDPLAVGKAGQHLGAVQKGGGIRTVG